jgi:transcriptional regulator with XRE-family HTH domain
LALGLSEKELSERLRVKISTVRSYKRRFLLGRPAIGVIQEILGGIAPSKGEVNWGGYLGRKREQILEVLRRAPRGLSTTDIAKEIKEVGGLLETDRSSEESPFAEIQDAEEAPLRSRSRLFAADEIKLPDLVVGVLGLNEQSKVLREGQPSDLALADQAVHGVRVTRATEPRSGGAPEAVKLD